jgi:hypothetical protein
MLMSEHFVGVKFGQQLDVLAPSLCFHSPLLLSFFYNGAETLMHTHHRTIVVTIMTTL